SGYAPYRTAYKVDNSSGASPNAIPVGTTCTNPSSPTANTGNLCESDAPLAAGTSAVTRYTYDTFGQRATMTTPKSIVETTFGTPPAYAYTYYADSDLDLSGSVSAGGWLKAVIDPTGHFVVFAYDRAGNV